MTDIDDLRKEVKAIKEDLEAVKELITEEAEIKTYRGSADALQKAGISDERIDTIFNGSGNPWLRAYDLRDREALRILMENVSSVGDNTNGRSTAAERIGISRKELAEFLGEPYDNRPSAGQLAAWERAAREREERQRQNIINHVLRTEVGPHWQMAERYYEMTLTGMSPDQIADRYKVNRIHVIQAVSAYIKALDKAGL